MLSSAFCGDPNGNRTRVTSVSKKKEPKWLFFRRDTPQSEEFQKQDFLRVKRLTRTDLKISREKKGRSPAKR